MTFNVLREGTTLGPFTSRLVGEHNLYNQVAAVAALTREGVSVEALKAGFEKNFGIDAWSPKPTNARMIWQRSRMVFPFLEVAHRVWLNATG